MECLCKPTLLVWEGGSTVLTQILCDRLRLKEFSIFFKCWISTILSLTNTLCVCVCVWDLIKIPLCDFTFRGSQCSYCHRTKCVLRNWALTWKHIVRKFKIKKIKNRLRVWHMGTLNKNTLSVFCGNRHYLAIWGIHKQKHPFMKSSTRN